MSKDYIFEQALKNDGWLHALRRLSLLNKNRVANSALIMSFTPILGVAINSTHYKQPFTVCNK